MSNHDAHGPVDEDAQDAYWRQQHEREPYYSPGQNYSEYSGAYRIGYRGRAQHAGRSYDDVEDSLKSEWEQAKGESSLAWENARQAIRAAWHRVERILPGDADRDGR